MLIGWHVVFVYGTIKANNLVKKNWPWIGKLLCHRSVSGLFSHFACNIHSNFAEVQILLQAFPGFSALRETVTQNLSNNFKTCQYSYCFANINDQSKCVNVPSAGSKSRLVSLIPRDSTTKDSQPNKALNAQSSSLRAQCLL